MIAALILTAIHHLLSPMFWKAAFTDGLGHEWRVMEGSLDGSIGHPWNLRMLCPGILKLFYHISRNFLVSIFVLKFLLLWAVVVLFRLYAPGANMWYFYLAVAVAGVWMNQRFNAYLEIALILGVMVLAGVRSNVWFLVLPIAASIAAFNRESFAVFFPMFFFMILRIEAQAIGLIFLAVSIMAFFSVYWFIWDLNSQYRHLTCPQHTPGWKLVKTNLLNPLTWILLGLAYWPIVHLHGVPWYFIPSCVLAVVLNFWYGNMRETALLLCPYILLIPYL